jgi:GDP-4-dehydro-6-deoxy-D-mannose reductase
MTERVVITGMAGFIGTVLAQVGRAGGARCIGVDIAERDVPDWHVMDLTAGASALADLLRAERPDVVYHLAGGPRGGDPLLPGISATRNLLAALREVPDQRPRVILVGSSAEYGDLGPEPIREDARECPVNEYGVGKLAQTRLGLVARRAGMRLLVARPFNIIGPGMSPALAPARFAREILAAVNDPAHDVRTGDLSPVRDYLDVEAVARALWTLGHVDTEHEIVNVCSGQTTSMRAVLDEILAQVGVTPVIHTEASALRGPGEIPVSRGDPTRLTAVTSETYRFSLGEAVARLLAWTRQADPTSAVRGLAAGSRIR